MSWLDMTNLDVKHWLPVPSEWPVPGLETELPDIATWAHCSAQDYWDMSLLQPGPGEVDHFASILVACAEKYPRIYPDFQLLLHLDSVRGVPLPVYAADFDISGAREGELRALTHADSDSAVEPPIVEEFSTAYLGTGLRVLRYFTEPGSNDIMVGLRYAFRVQEHGSDVLVLASAPDPGRVLKAMDDMDTFVRCLRFSPDEDD